MIGTTENTKDTKSMTDAHARELANVIRETSFAIHQWFSHGFLEKVYENALANRLRKQGLAVVQQQALPVRDEDGTVVGDYVADLVVNEAMIVELKAVRALDEVHLAQLYAYLRAPRLEHGLLINFGAPKLQIKKLIVEPPRG